MKLRIAEREAEIRCEKKRLPMLLSVDMSERNNGIMRYASAKSAIYGERWLGRKIQSRSAMNAEIGESARRTLSYILYTDSGEIGFLYCLPLSSLQYFPAKASA